MAFLNYFKPVPSWSSNQVLDFIKDKNPDEYQLIDVRQPSEYQGEHLPGARLIPIGELSSRLNELDPKKPTITY
ncbi:MAG: hypothetical protein CO150_02075 [Nitrospirae bacterium CG_4_9_14_3_um_filter_53_35]|nr:MAG: hypothetical protein AUK29_05495 [Nitrospirae bacterium CG2_30_53_67]PIS37772.1 MAG: hypothetical protein COT35_04295 [Nitrospirae bacterium CG08_land_8_20_14_0_20_52_24]PIV82555.1 MAG: hypothetical protein COW52_12925 [Nitrospirae bacterium CG17_big_fil_post_rev_8_21_14_2_50_50_9]PIW84356.1 MAG: hypothetical protein COZ95_10245 [Nitrospirae bacterium CG_4_8_14_3_um_filter_50_41]PIX85752.1 MAG: hypothetical protein COZ32_06865 [Nitrospirae bacterium CG_4_10_14_3_um_filter_53_41]PJA7710